MLIGAKDLVHFDDTHAAGSVGLGRANITFELISWVAVDYGDSCGDMSLG